MNIRITVAILFFSFSSWAQSLPFHFESDIMTNNFINFDGGIASVISNPLIEGENLSENVGQIVRNGGAIWAGSKVSLSENIDLTINSSISMKVYTTAPIGTIVKLKLEGEGSTERDISTTKSGQWETLTWDFTGEPSIFNEVVFMFDFGNVGDGSENSTFYFDDVQQQYNGIQIDLPVDWEGSEINYTTTDFGGNISELTTDPADTENTVVKVTKTIEAATWAGTTIGTPAGFATNIPLTEANSIMTVKVWSPDAGIPVRLKVEDSKDPTHTCETEVVTTIANDWEYLEFDFNNQAPGTELLSIGLQMGWTYNMASIFFNFGTEGVVAGEKVYYFDEVVFGALIIANENSNISDLNIYPNPAPRFWNIETEDSNIEKIDLFTQNGKLLTSKILKSRRTSIDASNYPTGTYILVVQTDDGISSVRRLIRN